MKTENIMKKVKLAIWVVIIAFVTILIYQTQSRAGLQGLVASLATMVLLVMLRKSKRLFYVSLLVVPLLGAGAIGGLWAGSTMFRGRMQPVVDGVMHCVAGDWEKAASCDSRPQLWVDSMAMIREHPLVGVGPGSYGQTYPDYRQRVLANWIEMVHPHNEPI